MVVDSIEALSERVDFRQLAHDSFLTGLLVHAPANARPSYFPVKK